MCTGYCTTQTTRQKAKVVKCGRASSWALHFHESSSQERSDTDTDGGFAFVVFSTWETSWIFGLLAFFTFMIEMGILLIVPLTKWCSSYSSSTSSRVWVVYCSSRVLSSSICFIWSTFPTLLGLLPHYSLWLVYSSIQGQCNNHYLLLNSYFVFKKV